MGEIRRLLPPHEVRSDPQSAERMRERGFDQALATIWAMSPETVIEWVTASGIKGRGGAAFPTGIKWTSVRQAPGEIKYVVMNADESELGTFKDRVLLEQDPLGALTGLLIAAYAVGARKAFCYIRGEYREVEQALANALETLRQGDWLRGVDVEIRRGAGAYIAGEETALFNSIEGKRPEPRVKPPFPTVKGLWSSPTLIQNVETLANVAVLFAHDVSWFTQYGTPKTPGTKLVALSGHIRRAGVYEVPFGVPLADIVSDPDLGGQVAGSGRLGAVLLGGAAGTFLTPEEVMNHHLDYESLQALGASIGSGAMMFFDDTVDLGWVVARLARFFAEESCGQCVPCRIGTRRLLEIVEAKQWESRVHDVRALAQAMRDASICGLGQTAPLALLSFIERPQLRPHA
ncbi:MAG: electron transport complex protein RnfC [Sulfobacillus thermosulfidooxidans]|uniref:complex I 51 kDa subunit family protein n=2 Tax=Sulfobacillus TaxID=28033 RepID=UPI000CD100FB|nr:NADH-ubiquinone oxidoreductase-F iron-sulfur binding region domain-containing protein [Sulfobacillus sp. hq2]POB10527.1 electron transport complex protein RnfC [Sulfobacillus sp. hq2]PSR36163.1 MAG: electron transport complex protein RnfC [Sulfobacillus thermosulfidooxidans]